MNQFIPKKFKHIKVHCYKRNNSESRYFKLKHGNYGLKAIKSGVINSIQLEACRRSITRKMKKKGKLYICVFPDRPVTCKSIGARMGNGKGSLSFWTFFVKKGHIIFELKNLDKNLAISSLKTASKKLPFKTKII